MKYGRSLSFCMADILDGTIPEKQVGAIVTSTACKDNVDWNRLLESYCETYWVKFDKEECFKLLFRLINSGKIVQPRLDDGIVQLLYAYPDKWVDSMEDAMKSLGYL